MKGSGILVWLLFVGLFGLFVPWFKGFDFLDPLLLIAYSCLSVLFVAPVVADLVAAQPRQAWKALLRGLAAGWGSGLLIVALGLATVSLVHAHRLLLPSASLLIAIAALSLAASVLTGAASALITLRTGSAASARRILRISFFVVLLIVVIVPRILKPDWADRLMVLTASSALPRLLWFMTIVFAIAAAGLLAVLRSRVARSAAAE